MLRKQGWDAIVIGAGRAGLSAALTLGRCKREALVFDRGTPRSSASRQMHGFLTRDRIAPDDFVKQAKQELSQYPSVVVKASEVERVQKLVDGSFRVVVRDGRSERCQKLLIAPGFDRPPEIPNITDFFGASEFSCP